ncbi:MAG: hypothetical protein WC943_13900 [Elusimicrobiota bacterium]|jgi:hypothetical protein
MSTDTKSLISGIALSAIIASPVFAGSKPCVGNDSSLPKPAEIDTFLKACSSEDPETAGQASDFITPELADLLERTMRSKTPEAVWANDWPQKSRSYRTSLLEAVKKHYVPLRNMTDDEVAQALADGSWESKLAKAGMFSPELARVLRQCGERSERSAENVGDAPGSSGANPGEGPRPRMGMAAQSINRNLKTALNAFSDNRTDESALPEGQSSARGTARDGETLGPLPRAELTALIKKHEQDAARFRQSAQENDLDALKKDATMREEGKTAAVLGAVGVVGAGVLVAAVAGWIAIPVAAGYLCVAAVGGGIGGGAFFGYHSFQDWSASTESAEAAQDFRQREARARAEVDRLKNEKALPASRDRNQNNRVKKR